jgi:tetratricopeptide (TPR) repeat protein
MLMAPFVLACGPHFPQGYVWQGTGEAMLDWPRTSFRMELGRYVGLPIPERGVMSAQWEKDTLPKDLEELEAVLFDAGEDLATVLEVSEGYARLRQNFYRRPGPQHETPATPYLTPELDAYLPAEFAIYAEGARLFHGRDYVGATAAWDALLALAPEERCHRSVWAAYMLGKTWLKRDGEIAPRYFEQAIALSEEGYEDSLGLAGASRYALSRIDEVNGNYAAAIHSYLEFIKRCEPFERIGGCRALERIAFEIFRNDAFDFNKMNDAESMNVLALWANSGDPWECRRWLEALKTMTPTREIHGAERIACSAYYAGDIPMAEAWLQYADKKDPHGQWLRAKLLARAGKMREAEAILASLANTFPPEYSWRRYGGLGSLVEPNRLVLGDLGTCRLNRGAYAGALEAFVRGGYEEDTAYVADRVLTTNELKAFVKNAGEAPWMLAPSDIRYGRNDLTQGETMKYLLGRRLARQGSMKEAESHFPDVLSASEGYWNDSSLVEQGDLKAVIRKLSESLRAANDGARSLEARAQSLMEAAWITRKWGLRLYGTAHAPDMEVFGGMYEFSTEPRTKSTWASDDERRRVAASAPVPDRRHHYRWVASDLLWKAAKFLPDNDERTARALWEGGRLIANRDPGGADKFYKALVNRCRNLPIGQEADRLRWFPPCPEAWEDPKWAGALAFE